MQEEYLKPIEDPSDSLYCKLANDCEKQKNSIKKFICKADYIVPGLLIIQKNYII